MNYKKPYASRFGDMYKCNQCPEWYFTLKNLKRHEDIEHEI